MQTQQTPRYGNRRRFSLSRGATFLALLLGVQASLPPLSFAGDELSLVETHVHTSFGSRSDWTGMGVGDVNGDGQVELVAVRDFDSDIYVFSIATNGRFRQLARYTGFESGSKFADLAVGDVDDDGIDEIVVSRHLDGHQFMFNVTSNWVFLVGGRDKIWNPSINWAGIGIGDLRNDGREEIVTLSNHWGNILDFAMWKGQFLLSGILNGISPNYEWAAVDVGDVDNDGDDEVVAVRNFDGDFFIYEAGPNGTYVEVARERRPGRRARWADIEIADINGDGRNEIIAARNRSEDFYIYEFSGSGLDCIGTFSTPGPDWKRIESIDFNGDGRDDIIAAGSDGDFYVFESIDLISKQARREGTGQGEVFARRCRRRRSPRIGRCDSHARVSLSRRRRP